MKTIKVTNTKELLKFIHVDLPEGSIDYTDLDDIDDTMTLETAKIGLCGAVMPELPHRDFTIATLTQDKLNQLKSGK